MKEGKQGEVLKLTTRVLFTVKAGGGGRKKGRRHSAKRMKWAASGTNSGFRKK